MRPVYPNKLNFPCLRQSPRLKQLLSWQDQVCQSVDLREVWKPCYFSTFCFWIWHRATNARSMGPLLYQRHGWRLCRVYEIQLSRNIWLDFAPFAHITNKIAQSPDGLRCPHILPTGFILLLGRTSFCWLKKNIFRKSASGFCQDFSLIVTLLTSTEFDAGREIPFVSCN